MAEFVTPQFLQNQSTEEIFEEMKSHLPTDIDVSAGSHPYNYIYPTALTVAMYAQIRLTEAIKLITPQYCHDYPEFAEGHGEMRGIYRKEAIKASGEIEVTAAVGTEILYGSKFATININNTPSVYFEALETVLFEVEDEVKTIKIQAVEAGTVGNVSANTITINASNIDGISSINNPTATTGGYDEEEIDKFIDRILTFDRTQGNSFVGNTADYIRWALEAHPGVGNVKVIEPTEDDGIITIVITGADGKPVTTDVLASVYNHIMDPTPLSTDGTRPDDEVTGYERLSPINSFITVTTPGTYNISLSVSVQIDSKITTLDTVKSELQTALNTYFAQATNYIYLSQIGSLITKIEGVIDYDMDSLLINGKDENIEVESLLRPTIEMSDISISTY